MKLSRVIYLAFNFLVVFFPFQSSAAFNLFIQADYKDMPDFSKYGFTTSEIIYEYEFYSKNESHDKLPRKIKVNSLIESIVNSASGSDYVVIDIETWFRGWRFKSPSARREILGRYERVLEDFKVGSPNIQFGLYGIVPAGLSRAKGVSYSASKIEKWVSENDSRKKIVSKVDFFSPSFYTHTQSIEEWEEYAKLMINKARELEPTKKIFPYIWPKYHQAFRKKSGIEKPYIPREFWRAQLEFLYRNADGLIIWDAGNQKKDWNEKETWWQETNSFLIDKGIIRSG